MKKVLVSTAFILGLVGLTGCGQPAPQTPDFSKCYDEGNVQAPKWVCDGGATMEGGVFAVGSASARKAGGIQFQRTIATQNARNALAMQMGVKVKRMLKQYQSTTGTGDNETFEQAITDVSKQVTSQTLIGSKIVDTWSNPKTHTLHVLVGMKDNVVKKSVKNAVNTTFKNNQALWQEFKSQKAQAELDAAVNREFSGNSGNNQ